MHGFDRAYNHYPYVYDKRAVRKEVAKCRALYGPAFIGSVHTSLGYQKEEKRRSQRSSLRELDETTRRFIEQNFFRPNTNPKEVVVAFISPSGSYSLTVIRSLDISHCFDLMASKLKEARELLAEHPEVDKDIDDPVWCLWSDIVDVITH